MNTRPSQISAARPARSRSLLLTALFLCASLAAARAEIQFDVFLGYGDLGGGGIVPEASWFPVVCEVKNDGPTFEGVIEVSSSVYNQNQTRRIAVELPTGTLKRLSIPVFSTARYQGGWDVRLLDDRGHVRAEHQNVGPRTPLAPGASLLGALPLNSSGTPVIRQVTIRNGDYQPAVARFPEAAILPDNPLEWEGMDSFYLNSQKALDLTADQVYALLAWLNAGGHLIIGVESVADINATPWLRSLVPCDLGDIRTVTNHPALQQWLSDSSAASGNFASSRLRRMGATDASYAEVFGDLPADRDFEHAELLVAASTPRNAQVLATAGDLPLMISAHQGRGRVTVLLFNPERDPVRSWKNLPSFWAKLAGVPAAFYKEPPENPSLSGAYSIDSVFGAMIDSKQVRKLPVEWLLLLLILYLVVIGPLDQYWLKRIKRPMLTWITFPCYVVCFSLLIYLIGYKLRAGETEWNELHFVDVLLNGDHAELRGRTYASIYSPVNASYRVESDLHFAEFRSEFHGSWGAAQEERADILQFGDNFKADIFVPVWTSQLYTSDWWQRADDVPLSLTVTPSGQEWSVNVINHLDHPIAKARLIIGNDIHDLDEIPAATNKTFTLTRSATGRTLGGFVHNQAGSFEGAASSRQNAFGGYGSGRIDNLPDSSMAISFLSSDNDLKFELTPGLDLSPLVEQNQAVLLAWDADYSPVKAFNQFPTRRSQKNTLWRVAVPINPASAPSP